jgi:hypothetical protein
MQLYSLSETFFSSSYAHFFHTFTKGTLRVLDFTLALIPSNSGHDSLPHRERFASTRRAMRAGQRRGFPACLRYSRADAAAMFIPRIRVSKSPSLSVPLPPFLAGLVCAL